jgi:uncharacterized protein (TIGR00661 family)
VKIKAKIVLVAPLDWGLGHTTRCIPIINALIFNEYEVILGASGKSAALFKKEFPQLTILPLPAYQIHYAKRRSWLPFKLFLQVPKIVGVIIREHWLLKKIVQQYQIDWIISDNRFGLYHTRLPSTFITHQLSIMAPYAWLRKCLQLVNYHFINQFNHCWVPDMANEGGLAGKLSHPATLPKTPVHYIGLLSRFNIHQCLQQTYTYDYCFLLSGPEPQRTMLEQIVLQQIEQLNARIIVLRGLPEQAINITSKHTILSHLPGEELKKILINSEYVIARSGYTSIMELLSLQKKCFLIPTPGQTEQEYLAKRLTDMKICFSIQQHKLDFIKQLPGLAQFPFCSFHSEVFSVEKFHSLLENM